MSWKRRLFRGGLALGLAAASLWSGPAARAQTAAEAPPASPGVPVQVLPVVSPLIWDVHQVESLSAPLVLSLALSPYKPALAAERLNASLAETAPSRHEVPAGLFAHAADVLRRPQAYRDPRKELSLIARDAARRQPGLKEFNALAPWYSAAAMRPLVGDESFRGQTLHFDVMRGFGLLEDAFDRGVSHADFLKNTKNLQADKAELLSHAVGPAVLEVGPGGGTNLGHLDNRLRNDSGLDRLVAVEGSLKTSRSLQELHEMGRLSAQVLHGNALELKAVLARAGIKSVDTIVYSSVLHEVFSYSVYQGRRYNLDAVRDVLVQSLKLLNPGGRLLLRDPVEPEDGRKLQRLVLKGRAIEAFAVFIHRFGARKVPHAIVRSGPGELEVELSKRDISEFIYKLSWGARAFPYELQEQYGVLTRRGWLGLIGEAARVAGVSIRMLPLPSSLASYLQPGYLAYLAHQVEIKDRDGHPAEWPDSNMAIVVEKKG